MGRHLEWSEIYAFQKVFPLLTRWQLEQKSAAHIINSHRGFVAPGFIKKKRNPKGVPCYEIIWRDDFRYFTDIFPDEQIESYLLENDNNLDSLWTTIEPSQLVDRVYPQLVLDFEAEKLAKKKKPKTKRVAKSPSTAAKEKETKKSKPSDSLNDFSSLQSELDSITVKPKKKTGTTAKKPQSTLENFLQTQMKPPALHPPADDSLFALADDLEDDCENILDLSNLISGIVTRSPMVKRLQGHELVYSEFKEEVQAYHLEDVKGDEERADKSGNEKNQSLDDIDLMIMRRKPKNPKHKRVSSLRMELLSSTPNSKGLGLMKDDINSKLNGSSFFSPATENDVFESSYNALINTPGTGSDIEVDEGSE